MGFDHACNRFGAVRIKKGIEGEAVSLLLDFIKKNSEGKRKRQERIDNIKGENTGY